MNNAVRINYDKHTAEILCADTESGDFVPVLIDLDKLRIVDAATNYSWYLLKTSRTNPTKYAVARHKNRLIYMHRLLCPSATKGLEVSHRNHSGTDNRICNLEVLPVKIHRQLDHLDHDRPHKKSNTGIRGVRQIKEGIYEAFHNQKRLGHFDTLDAASIVAKQYREYNVARLKAEWEYSQLQAERGLAIAA